MSTTPPASPRENICPGAPRKLKKSVLNEKNLNISNDLSSKFKECAAADGFTTPPPSPRNNTPMVCPWAPPRPIRPSM